jgi:membrane AbrB-like protein
VEKKEISPATAGLEGGKGRISPVFKWLGLSLLSYLIFLLLDLLTLPGSRFLGPLCAGIIVSIRGWGLRLPGALFNLSKGFLGLRIAGAVGPAFLGTLFSSWHLLIGGTVWTMAAACLIGVVLTRMRVLEGSTAIWGLSPGGASLMTVMSEDYGADSRAVALMQYSRVVIVSLTAILVARIWAHPSFVSGGGDLSSSSSSSYLSSLFFPFYPVNLLIMGGLIALGLYLARLTRFPGGAILFPMILGAVAKNLWTLDITIPPFLLYPAYAFIGWRVGLGFSREELLRLTKKLPILLFAIFLLIALAALYGFFMAKAGELDPLTAYLATSPGGLDAVTIIAAATTASLPFIAAMQTLRLILVIIFGPILAKFACGLTAEGEGKGGPEGGGREGKEEMGGEGTRGEAERGELKGGELKRGEEGAGPEGGLPAGGGPELEE